MAKKKEKVKSKIEETCVLSNLSEKQLQNVLRTVTCCLSHHYANFKEDVPEFRELHKIKRICEAALEFKRNKQKHERLADDISVLIKQLHTLGNSLIPVKKAEMGIRVPAFWTRDGVETSTFEG